MVSQGSNGSRASGPKFGVIFVAVFFLMFCCCGGIFVSFFGWGVHATSELVNTKEVVTITVKEKKTRLLSNSNGGAQEAGIVVSKEGEIFQVLERFPVNGSTKFTREIFDRLEVGKKYKLTVYGKEGGLQGYRIIGDAELLPSE